MYRLGVITMTIARVLAAVALAAITSVCASSGVLAQYAPKIPAAAQALAGQHPAEYYKRAADLYKAGNKDDAVFIFYLGQLRYRTHLLARPDLKPDGDLAMFNSLSEVVGRPINEYAFGDIPALARTVDAVLAYDQQNPDGFTSPVEFAKTHDSVRAGLVSMKAQMLATADTIRAQRVKNGLENRQ